MTDKEREKIGLFKYSLISSLVSGTHDCKSNNEYFLKYGDKEYKNHNQELVYVTSATLDRYYYSYMKYGLDALIPKKRQDKGHSRKLDDDLKKVIKHYVDTHPRLPSTAILHALLNQHYIEKNDVSLSTITRYVNKYKSDKNIHNKKEIKRYEKEFINEVWCCDTSYSLYLTVDGKKIRTYIIAIIDDASRMIVGADVFFNDNTINFMSVLKTAISKYGKPKTLNLDNGSSYKNSQIALLGARCGISLHYNAPYEPIGKAKIERWFRTMKDHFQAIYPLKYSTTLNEYKEDFYKYVLEYNNKIHSSLNGLTPFERFFNGNQINKISDDVLEKNFLLEIERKVTADSVVVIDSIEYEVPYHYAKQRIRLRYSSDLDNVYVVSKDNELIKIQLLNKIANGSSKRNKPLLKTEDN